MATWATCGRRPLAPLDLGVVADREGLGVAGDAQVAADLDAAAGGRLHAERVGERVGPHAGRPDERVGVDHLAARRGDPGRGDALDRRAGADVDAAPLEGLAGVALRRRR